MKKLFIFALLAIAAPLLAYGYSYESVEGDPMKARIYTLPNGLKIYISQNADEPRIQTYIAVRAGGKNDPHESTGLAHYLEHLMFKGTMSVGVLDYEKESPLLDSIRAQYELYGHTVDTLMRKAIYHRIDSLSYEASKYAIANEYDKLMAAIGSNGSNAYTSEDVTCYTEDIPSNEVERWARVQADRFQNMVIRGFHTELEAVYEEYNIYLTDDFDKIDETINKVLYPNHPYGMQTVIGKQEHLKNPSLENVLAYYHTWYVPNNIAICMSGDIQDPDSIVGIIDRSFGDWMANESLPVLQYPAEEPLTSPVIREIVGHEMDMVTLAWRFPAAKERTTDILQILSDLLSNNRAGLFDIDLNQNQRVLNAEAYLYAMNDYSKLMAVAVPKEGQTLEQARDLMLEEFRKLREGDFDEALLQAIINNAKRDRMSLLENNRRMANLFVQCFINGVEWKDQVEEIDRLSRITKQDVMDFAGKYLTDNYVCVLKRTGEDPNEKKIEKPEINPIEVNRDKQSQFVTEVVNETPHEIEPVFVDFEKDMTVDSFDGGNDFLYKHNDTNGLFMLSYIIDRGTKIDPSLDIATQYIEYLGTRKMSAEALQTELYRLACDVNFHASTDRTSIVISGLSENMQAAVKLAEDWLYNAEPNKEIYDNMVADILKTREDDKLDQRTCYQRLFSYGMYGEDNPQTHQLTEKQLYTTSPTTILKALQDLKGVHQTISYYGPVEADQVKAFIGKTHTMAKHPQPMAVDNDFVPQQVIDNSVLIAPYVAKNIYMSRYSNNGQVCDISLKPAIDLFNEYFGGGMNTVVFQELRESRGLAYSASAFYSMPWKKGLTNSFFTNIITQNDKMGDCLDVFHEITEQMPLSEGSFSLAKTSILKQLATRRVMRARVLSYYMQCRDMGLTSDPNKDVYHKVSEMTMDDLSQFHQENVKGRAYTTLVLGDEGDLDMDKLSTLGSIRHVSLEDIFGY